MANDGSHIPIHPDGVQPTIITLKDTSLSSCMLWLISVACLWMCTLAGQINDAKCFVNSSLCHRGMSATRVS